MNNLVKQQGFIFFPGLFFVIVAVYLIANILGFSVTLQLAPNRAGILPDKPISFCLKELPTGVNITSTTCQQDGATCVLIASDKSCRVNFSANIEQVQPSWHPVFCQKDAPSYCFEPNNSITIAQMINQKQ